MSYIKHRGFTLIEVLIALVIVSIALMGLISAGINYTYQQNNIKQVTLASWVARDCINKAKLQLIDLPNGPSQMNGASQMLGENFPWQIHREKTPDLHTDKLRVTVFNQNNSSLLSMTGFIARTP